MMICCPKYHNLRDKMKTSQVKLFNPYAQFETDNSLMYRTKTYLSYTCQRKRCVGVVIMVNPGSSIPKGELHVVHEASEDKSLQIVNEVVSKAYNLKGIKPNDGDYIEIFNTFNLCKWPLHEAIKLFLKQKDSKYMFTPMNINSDTEWLWVAWGKDGGELTGIKEQIYNQLDKSKIIGIYEDGYYYHPLRIQIKGKKKYVTKQITNYLS